MGKYPANPNVLKKCKECEQEKPLSEYYKHDNMSDGYLSMCKACKCFFIKEHRELDVEKARRYERAQYHQRKDNGKRKGRAKAGPGTKTGT